MAKKKAKKKRAKRKIRSKSAAKGVNLNKPTSVIDAVVKAVKKRNKDFETGVAGEPVIYFDTGSYALNWCISGQALSGGMPGGRVVEIFGDPATGKSLILYKMMAAVCAAGGFIILDDTESCYMEPYARHLGVDTDRVIPMDSDTAEEHFERVIILLDELRSRVGSEVPIMIALDSLALLRTEHEAETEITKRDLSKASVVRKGMRLLRTVMRRDLNTVYVVANHKIANIGDRFNPSTTPGGKSVPFQCSVRIELLMSNAVKEEKTERKLGVEVIARVVKNKIIEPFRQCRLRVMYKSGIVPDFHLYDIAQIAGVCKPAKAKKGEGESKGWYDMEGVHRSFQRKYFYDNLVDRALKLLDVGRPTGSVTEEFKDLVESEEAEKAPKAEKSPNTEKAPKAKKKKKKPAKKAKPENTEAAKEEFLDPKPASGSKSKPSS